MPPAARPHTLPSAALLAGLRVVEITTGVAGAYCGKLLAQLGAAVQRVPLETAVVVEPSLLPLMQRVLHDGKASIDAAQGAALDAALADADVVIVEALANGHPLAARVRALIDGRAGPAAVQRSDLRADAVVVALTAGGVDEDRRTAACALTAAAESGMTFAIGDPGAEPLTPPYDIADYEAGVNGACAALAGVLGGMGRDTGVVDVAVRDVLANLVGTLAYNYLPYGRPWRREGTRPSMSGGVYPCGLFPCKDGYVAIYCRGLSEWQGIVEAMGHPDWSREPRFADPRVVAKHHADEADARLLPWLAQFDRAELQELGTRFGFPAAPVKYVREALGDAQFAFRGSLPELPGANGLRVPAVPWRLYERDSSATPGARAGPIAPIPFAPATPATDPAHILAGLRVLDFSWVWSGPMVTAILADLGAEVIKVEHPSRLDSLRQRGRALRDGVEIPGPATELNPWFNQLNHAKKSVILDLKSADDCARLRQLARSCDVVVENMRPGALADAGLDYATLSADRPDLVMLSMSMAGQAGPLARMKGYAGIMTSMAGLESVVGYESAQPDAPFTGMTMTALGDPNGAAHGMAVLLAALLRRRATGRGAWIDLSQTDAILAILAAPIVESQGRGHVGVRGNARPDAFPHGHFRCRGDDRWIAIAIRDDREWQALLRHAQPVLDAWRGLDLAGRQAQRAAIEEALRAWTCGQDADALAAVLAADGVPAAPVASYPQMIAAPWKQRRGIVRNVDHCWLGAQDVFVPPWRFGGVTPGVARAAPLLGEHTDEVLRILGERGAPAA